MADLPGVSKTKDAKDGTDIYTVPVAERVLAGTPQITMLGIGRAKVEFGWKWAPNQVGELLEASGPLVKSFNTWDRGTLIAKFNAKFYHGDPTKAVQYFARGDKGWQTTAE
jgi:hypothetical protein